MYQKQVDQQEHPGIIQEKYLKEKNGGHMGNVRVTKQNLKIVKMDKEHNIVYVKGSKQFCCRNKGCGKEKLVREN